MKVVKFDKEGFTLNMEKGYDEDIKTIEYYQVPNPKWCAACEEAGGEEDDDDTGMGFQPTAIIFDNKDGVVRAATCEVD